MHDYILLYAKGEGDVVEWEKKSLFLTVAGIVVKLKTKEYFY